MKSLSTVWCDHSTKTLPVYLRYWR